MTTDPLNLAHRVHVTTTDNGPAAVEGLETVRHLPAPLRLRAAIDRGWKPGLWLARSGCRRRGEASGVG